MKYVSPSSLKMYERNPEKFYVTYLSKAKPPRPPQLQVMAIGSAVDARIKAFLSDEFDLVELFESQVEKQNREWAWKHSEDLFEAYRASGGLSDLMQDIEHSVMAPAYEFDAVGEMEGIPLFGKPDMFWVTEGGIKVIVDYKVNGYCGASGVSPTKGYIKCRERDGSCKRYPQPSYGYMGGLEVNMGLGLDETAPDWAMQGATYAWMLGCEIGDPFVVQIEQFACRPSGVRIATHRSLISREFQEDLLDRYKNLWYNTDWYDERLEQLAAQIKKDPKLWDMF